MLYQVCSAITNTSCQSCYICGCKPSEMNNLTFVSTKMCKMDNLKFGLSVLHANIRFFECLLHLSYRLEIQIWRVSIFSF